MLVREGPPSAVIDFGTCGVGDLACDHVDASTYLDNLAQDIFQHTLDLDADT